MEDNLKKEYLFPFKRGMSLFISQSHVHGLQVGRWRSDGEMVKVVVRGGCSIQGDGWMEETEVLHLRVECKNPKSSDPVHRPQLLAFSCLIFVASLSVIIYALHRLTCRLSTKQEMEASSLSGHLKGCHKEPKGRMQDDSTRCRHMTSSRDETSHVPTETIFIVSSKSLDNQRMMMIGGVTEGGMKGRRRKEECLRCFPLFKSSSNFSSQPDVLHQRIKPSSACHLTGGQSQTASTSTTPVSQRSSFLTSLFIIVIVISASSSSSSSSSCYEEDKAGQIIVCLPEHIPFDAVNIYLDGVLVKQSRDKPGKGVNKPIQSFRHSFSSRELDVDHVINELEHDEEMMFGGSPELFPVFTSDKKNLITAKIVRGRLQRLPLVSFAIKWRIKEGFECSEEHLTTRDTIDILDADERF